jgi:hypothetical protein
MRPLLALLLLCATSVHASQPLCGTSVENDERVSALHERTRARLASLATDPSRPVLLRDGAFHLQNDETITAGYRPFDLAGQSLVFTQAGSEAVTMRRVPLQYAEPAGAPLRDFENATGVDWHYVAHDLPFALPLFGKSVTRIYVSAFNGIHTAVPAEQVASQFDAAEAAVQRGPLLSPLMITMAKPRYLEFPRVWIDQTSEAVTVTWRSSANAPFGYDLQAKLAQDGTITYSYRDVVAMRWGTPVVSAGFDPREVPRLLLRSVNDSEHDVPDFVRQSLRSMLDVRRVDTQRLGSSDLFAVQLMLAEKVDRTKLEEGELLTYEVSVGGSIARVEFDRHGMRVSSFDSTEWSVEGAAANMEKNVIELFGVQRFSQETSTRVRTLYGAERRAADSTVLSIPFTAPPRTIERDLSAVAEDATLALPLAEPFVLGAFDPLRVWDLVRTSYGISTHDYDAVAMYQTFFTDIIFYAGAYATRGNPQVDGIASTSRGITRKSPRAPTLLHMNQLAYNYHSVEERASQVMLHEFGHRWLYHFQIEEGGDKTSALNPVSPHPAAYVHTPSAFPVYGEQESSVMGGGYFTPQTDGSYLAHAANYGYSWTDLYLMGLASPEEVPPWFYIAGSSLPLEYWPADGDVATGEKRDVEIGQILAAHGPRLPSAATSQRQFRVLFVLVSEQGVDATDAEVAKLNHWRTLMERNFEIATGGRGKLITTFVRPGKRRTS